MRRIVLFFVLMITGIGMIFAQSGQKLSYQAVIRNSANQLVTNTQLEVTIGIANSENGAAVYTEHHTVTTNANGLISLMIGTGDNRTGNWDQIEWVHAYVTTNTVVDGVPVSHRVELTAVAHAFYADNVDEETITEVLNDHGIVDGAEPNVQGDWNQENTGADDFIKNKPNFNNVAISGDYNDLSNKPDLDQYATNVHLNDTLNNYLTIEGLCDSIKNCEVIANLQTADSLLGVRITRDSIALSQKIYSDSAYLKRLIDSTTVIITNNTTNITNNTTNISNITNNITSLQVADSLLNARFARDSIALSKRLDTMFTHVCDSIEQCEVIQNMRDSIRANAADIQTNATNIANIRTDITNLQNADAALSARITADSILSYKADSVLSARITADSTNLANNYYNKIKINDTVAYILSQINNTSGNLNNNYYTKPEINDTLSHYTTSDEIDSLLRDYAKKDTLENYLTIDGLCDSIKKCEVITNLQNADSILAARITTDSILSYKADSALAARITADSILSYKSDSVLSARIIADSLLFYKADSVLLAHILTDSILSYRADSALLARILKDSVVSYRTDSVLLARILNDSALSYKADSVLLALILKDSANLANNYYTKAKINDTLSHYTTTDHIDSLLRGYATNDTLNHYTTTDHIDSLLRDYAKSDTLKNYLTIDGLCDSIKKCEVITNLQNTDSLLGVRVTADSILSYKADSALAARITADSILSYKSDSVLSARITADSILSYRSDSILSARITADSILSYKADSLLSSRITADSTNLANNYYNKTKINDTVAYILSQITSASVDLNDNYYTKPEINDTLSHYTTTDQIDSLLRDYAKSDTLKNYLTIDGLCDSIKKCEVITNLQNADSVLAVRITADSILSYKSDSVLSARIIADSLLFYKADSVLLAHILTDSILSYRADSALLARILKDSVVSYRTDSVLLARILNDSALSYKADSVLLDLILKDSANLANNYYTSAKINDTLSHYTTTDHIDSLLRGYATNDTLKNYLTIDGLCDSIKKCEVITNLQNADSLLSVRITRDSILSYKADSALAARITADSILSYKSDSVLSARITADSILSYKADSVLSARIYNDSILSYKSDSVLSARITADSTNLAQNYYNKTKINDTVRYILGQINTATGDLNDNYYTKPEINDTLGHYTTSDVIDSLLRGYATNDTLKNYLTISGLCDSIKKCEVIQTMRDSIRTLSDSIRTNAANITNNTTNITNITNNVTNITNNITNLQDIDSVLSARITRDSILSYKADSVLAARLIDTANKIREDFPKVSDKTITIKQGNETIGTFTLNQENDYTLTIPTPPDAQVQSDWNQSTTTAKDYIKNKPNIRDSVNRVVLDSLYAANSAMNKAIDTIARNVSLDVVSDSTRMVFDTLHKYYATKDTLKNFVNKTDLCNNVMACDGIQTMQTSITDVKNNLDSTKVNIRNEMGTLKTNLQQNIDSTSTNVRGALKDSLSRYLDSVQVRKTIHDSIGNGTLTIKQGETVLGTFSANQNTPETINITVPAAVTDLSDGNQYLKTSELCGKIESDCDNVPLKNADNEFTGTNRVPRGFDIKTTNESNCDNIVVNACDLWAMFDSLNRRIDKLERELEARKPSLTVTASDDSVTVCGENPQPVTYTATFHNCSSSDYTLSWKVNGVDSSNVTGSTLTFNAETAITGEYEVVCIATRSDNTYVTDTVTTKVFVDNNIPSFDTTVHNLTVNLSHITNTVTIQWDTDSLPVAISDNSATHTYTVADTVTITATNEHGCTFSMEVILHPSSPAVTTVNVPEESVTATTAKVNCNVNSDGGIPSTRRGVLFSVSNPLPRLGGPDVDSVMNGTGIGDFVCDLTRLIPCSQYHVCAFAINEVDTAYGDVLSFATPSFTCGDPLIDIDGNEYATLRLGSQCWMKQNLRVTHYADGDTIILDVNAGVNIPRRYAPGSESAEVINAYGYLYNWFAATRGTSSSDNPSGVQGVCPDGWHLPSDAEWTQLTDFVASDFNNVCGNNPKNIIQSLASQEGWDAEEFDPLRQCPNYSCYMCTDVTTNNNTQFSALPTGTWENGHGAHGYTNYGHTIFTSATENDGISALVRQLYNDHTDVERTANDKQSAYSVRCVLDTCTMEPAYKPTVSAVEFTVMDGNAVSMTSNVVSDGRAAVTERGVCWSTQPHPEIPSSEHTAASGSGIGEFSVTQTLAPGTTYYVRAYAINSVGTAYGAEVIYVMPILPIVTTSEVSNIAATTATAGGNVTIDDGGAPVTDRGVCWSAYGNPTIDSSHTINGSGTGSFTSEITGLSPTTTYYVRAYATNDGGTTYGSQVSFTTTEALPVVTTSAVSDITLDNTTINATCGGNVTDAGASAVIARGVCWSTSDNPTVSNSHTTDGSGLGSFTSSLTGLTAGQTYYVRAYATNSSNTAYGNQVSFTLPVVDTKSCPSAPVVTDHEGNVYATVEITVHQYNQAIKQCWMRENLRTTTSPKTGTYLVNTEQLSSQDPSQYLGSKVAHWYNNDSITYAPKGYGLLYNWCAAMDTANPNPDSYMEVPIPSSGGNNDAFRFSFSDPHRGICPEGWHVPSYNELYLLSNEAWNYAIKLAYGNDWLSSTGNTPGNINNSDRNALGFTAFPAGQFSYSYDNNGPIGSFSKKGEYANFWTTMQYGSTEDDARHFYLSNSGNRLTGSGATSNSKGYGFSVRCIKNE